MGKMKHVVLATALVIGGTSLVAPLTSHAEVKTATVKNKSSLSPYAVHASVGPQLYKAVNEIKGTVDLTPHYKKLVKTAGDKEAFINYVGQEMGELVHSQGEYFYVENFEVSEKRVKITYSQSKSKIDEMRKVYIKEIDKFLADIIVDGMTPLDKVRVIHNKYIRTFSLEQSSFFDQSYSTLITKKGGIVGHTGLFQSILSRAHIGSYVTIGRELKPVGIGVRTWTTLYLDSKTYHIMLKPNGTESLDNFLRTGKSMEKGFDYDKVVVSRKSTTDGYKYIRDTKAFTYKTKAYFLDKSGSLYSSDLNGKKKTLLAKGKFKDLRFEKGILYYTNVKDNKTKKYVVVKQK